MEYKRFDDTIFVRLEKGEDIIQGLEELIEKEDIKLGYFNGLGAVNDVEIGLFDTEEKKYYSNNYQDTYEVASLHGNITRMDGQPYIHAHIIIADIDQKCYGGHLNKAIISATGEIVVKVLDGSVEREFNEEVGLNFFKFD